MRSTLTGRLSDPAEKALGNVYFSERNFDLVEKLCAMAELKACTPAALAVSWLLSRPEVASVIAGVTRMEQLEDNVRAGQVPLSILDIEELDGMSRTESVLNCRGSAVGWRGEAASSPDR